MMSRAALFITITSVGFALLIATRPSLADERCHQLETLAKKYAGVELSASQKQMKRHMVVWYGSNCRVRHSAQAD